MKLSEELQKRGFIYQFSSENLSDILDNNKRTVYLGVDPTADAIHIGNLVPYLLLNHLERAGHKVILLIGGGTALIGDPSGRDTERDLVSEELVKERALKMEANIKKLTKSDIRFVNNYDWLSKLSAIEFMREVGKCFTINSLIKKDAIKARMESENGISYTEFSYNLLQSYDFYQLNQLYGCDLQIGGSDQWGNITGGIDYVRRMNGNEVYGITMPLIIDKASGKKFGKSMGNAVWLDEKLTSPYELYQFWFNTSDDEVGNYLRLFTLLDLDKIAEIEAEHIIKPQERLAQECLAKAVISFVYGEKVATEAALVTAVLFGKRELEDLTETEQEAFKKSAPRHKVKSGTDLISLLLETSLAASKREAREFLAAGAISLGSETLNNESAPFRDADIGLVVILKRGKKKRVLIEVE